MLKLRSVVRITYQNPENGYSVMEGLRSKAMTTW